MTFFSTFVSSSEFGIDFEAFSYLTFENLERIIGSEKKDFGVIIKLNKKIQDLKKVLLIIIVL